MEELLQAIQACKICLPHLKDGVNPVLSVSSKSKIIIIGQAPGKKVHHSGIPWQDKSGERLRDWLAVTSEQFYNPDNFGILPMGFCYPGKGKSGDLPPRTECAPLWHQQVMDNLTSSHLTLLIGTYAQHYYLGSKAKPTLTQTVQDYQAYLPTYLPLPHPSPRNNIWLRKNPWFEIEVLPILKSRIKEILK